VITEDPKSQVAQLQREVELLRAERDEYLEQLKLRDRKIDDLQHQVQALLRRYFGRSSEKMDPRQRLLFENLIDNAILELPSDDAGPDESSPTHRRKGHGRRRLPTNLPREKVIHDLPEDEKPCPCCGKLRHIIGKQTHEQLDYVPAKVKVIEHVRLTYGCPQCEQDASPDGPQIVTADKPLQPIEKGLAAPGLLSYVIVSKYGDHLPLHRLERIFDRYGIDIARSTMCDWAAQCADALRPLYELMVDDVRASQVIHTDDTPVKVQDRSRTQTRTGRFWVYLGDADHPSTVFAYTPSRSRDGPMAFLRDWGKDERVYLQADAFGGYDGIYAGEAGGHVTEVACWAHARRKFYDARSSDPAGSAQALAYIKLLYGVEKQAKQEAEKTLKSQCAHDAPSDNETDDCDDKMHDRDDEMHDRRCACDAPSDDETHDRRSHELLVENRLRLRKDSATLRLADFRAWLQSQQAERGGAVLPKSPLGQAIQYALNQWAALCVYATDGRLAIDNNAAENALRRVAIGRKNWLFAGSDNGGRTAATLFSLIATCQRNKVEPMAYLRDVLTRIAAIPINQLATLLPDRWQPMTGN
jgi:transposase